MSKPQVKINTRPLNKVVDVNEPTVDRRAAPVYQAVVVDSYLKMVCTVIQDQSDKSPEFEFTVSDWVLLYLDMPKNDTTYVDPSPSAVQTYFATSLDPYGIQIKKVDSNKGTQFYSRNFLFADAVKRKELEYLICQECLRRFFPAYPTGSDPVPMNIPFNYGGFNIP